MIYIYQDLHNKSLGTHPELYNKNQNTCVIKLII